MSKQREFLSTGNPSDGALRQLPEHSSRDQKAQLQFLSYILHVPPTWSRRAHSSTAPNCSVALLLGQRKQARSSHVFSRKRPRNPRVFALLTARPERVIGYAFWGISGHFYPSVFFADERMESSRGYSLASRSRSCKTGKFCARKKATQVKERAPRRRSAI